MELSRQRLVEQGFHPAVTSKSHAQLLVAGGDLIKKHWHRPTWDDLSQERHNPDCPGFTQPRQCTRTLLDFRNPPDPGRFEAQAPTENGLARLLNLPHIGGIIAENIFAEGYSSVHKVALTSTQSWAAMAAASRIWDFYAADFSSDGPARTFIAVTPEHKLAEFQAVLARRPCSAGTGHSQPGWFAEAKAAETDTYAGISRLCYQFKKSRNSVPTGFMGDQIAMYASLLSDDNYIHTSNQFESGIPSLLFDPAASFSFSRLRKMMSTIYEKRAVIKVLHFQKTPFLDRRLLAVILRSCHCVEMVGVYDCPLIHFGDVICLLDLIQEINNDRRRRKRPQIKAFDFFPRFHHGMPYQNANARTYGLTWGPDSLEVVQRGFFSIILKAFLKARTMKLDLLFAKGGAFCDFLYNVPNYTLAVASFLDGLYRYADLQRKRRPGENDVKQALYDLLKPVRLGLDDANNDWPDYYTRLMGNNHLFCSSCGYEMLNEFFTSLNRAARPLTRVCAGCLLRRRLDMEEDHLKGAKRQILDIFFVEQDKMQFNRDAWLGNGARGLMRLASTVSTRPPPPPIVVNQDGELVVPEYKEPLLRDNKIFFDSLRGLPDLEKLFGEGDFASRWREASIWCRKMDMYSRMARRVEERKQDGGKLCVDLKRKLGEAGADGGVPDSVHERQPPRPLDEELCCASHNFDSVMGLEKYLYKKNWL